MQRLRSLWDTYGSLTCLAVFGLAAIIAAQLSMNALLDTNLTFFETERASTEPIPRKTAALPDTSTWQTYRNEQYGFELKHPQGFAIEVMGNSKGELEVEKGKEYSGKRALIAIHPLIADGGYFPTTLLIISATPKLNYYGGILDKPRHVRNSFYYFVGATDGEVGKFVANILSTLKFIEPVDTSTWETYRNTEGGFELKYPPTWFIYPYSAVVTLDNSSHPNTLVVTLQSSDTRKNLHGIGFPPVGEMWISISKGDCSTPHEVFASSEVGPRNYILEKIVCRYGFLMLLGLWDADSIKEQHQELLEAIAATFRRV